MTVPKKVVKIYISENFTSRKDRTARTEIALLQKYYLQNISAMVLIDSKEDMELFRFFYKLAPS